MKKETFIAIFLGILFGVAVAIVMLLKTRESQLSKAKPMSPTLKITPTIVVKNTDFQPLEISEPETDTITDKKTITITGKTQKESLIIVESPIYAEAKTNTADAFSFEVPLALGENNIHIYVYPKNSQEIAHDKELKIYYLDEQ